DSEKAALTRETPAPARKIAITTLALLAPDRAIEVLPAFLDPHESDDVQLTSVEALGLMGGKHVPPLILERWPTMSPSVKREAAEVVLASPEGVEELLKPVREGRVRSSDIDPARRAQLLKHHDESIRKRAGEVLGKPAPNRAEVLSRYQLFAKKTGDMKRGGELVAKHCATCHNAESEGRSVAPNLATVANLAPEELLIRVLDPNREVAPPYVSYVVATKDGRVHTGIIAEENANSITLRRSTSEGEVVFRSEIDEIRSTGLSLMPEDLETQLDPQAVTDVIAYIRGLAQL